MAGAEVEHKKNASPVARWDGTLQRVDGVDELMIIAALKVIAKKYCFQLEKVAHEHWQIRLSLHTKKRLPELLSLLKSSEATLVLVGCHWSPSSNNSGAGFNYVMKLDSRVRGPWKDDDPMPNVWDEDLELPLRTWQRMLVEKIRGPISKRAITFVLDRDGGKGKTHLKTWLSMKKLACVVPVLSEPKDIAQLIMSKIKKTGKIPTCFVLDIPRALKTTKHLAFMSALESLKDGYVYDTRYSFTDQHMKRPHVVVFCNKLPPVEALSADRIEVLDLAEWGRDAEIPPAVAVYPVEGEARVDPPDFFIPDEDWDTL